MEASVSLTVVLKNLYILHRGEVVTIRCDGVYSHGSQDTRSVISSAPCAVLKFAQDTLSTRRQDFVHPGVYWYNSAGARTGVVTERSVESIQRSTCYRSPQC